MKTYLALLLLLVGFAKPVLADHKHATVHVKGMVCDFCSTGLKKVFKGQPSISKIEMNLDKKVVEIAFKHGAGELADEKIKELITDAGYNVEKISRK